MDFGLELRRLKMQVAKMEQAWLQFAPPGTKTLPQTEPQDLVKPPSEALLALYAQAKPPSEALLALYAQAKESQASLPTRTIVPNRYAYSMMQHQSQNSPTLHTHIEAKHDAQE